MHFSLEPAARMGRPQQHNNFLRTSCYSNALVVVSKLRDKRLPCCVEDINKRRITSSIRVGSDKDRKRYSYAADTILGSDGKGLRLLYRHGPITSPASNAEFNP